MVAQKGEVRRARLFTSLACTSFLGTRLRPRRLCMLFDQAVVCSRPGLPTRGFAWALLWSGIVWHTTVSRGRGLGAGECA